VGGDGWLKTSEYRQMGAVAQQGGQVGARFLGRRPWGRNSTLFAVILNVFKQKFRPKRIF